MNKLVSIIIPCYNSEMYIEQCIKSVINQTYKNIEIILINDGSKDETGNIIKEYREKYDNILLIDRENKGVQYCRKEGIEKSNGEYVFFIDSDDCIDPNTISDMIFYADKYNADIVKGSYKKEINKKIKVKSKENINFKIVEKENFKDEIYSQIIENYKFCNIWGQLIRKNIINIDSIDINLKYAEDLKFNLDILTICNKIILLQNKYYHYRLNMSSAIYTKDEKKAKKRIEDTIFVYSELYEYLKKWNMETKENLFNVSNRILKETILSMEVIYKNNKIEKKYKTELFNSVVGNEKIKKAKEILLDKDNKYSEILSTEKKLIRFIKKKKVKEFVKTVLKRILIKN